MKQLLLLLALSEAVYQLTKPPDPRKMIAEACAAGVRTVALQGEEPYERARPGN
jgi:hypothetical protein